MDTLQPVRYANLRVLSDDEPRGLCGPCVESSRAVTRRALYKADETYGRTTFVGEYYCRRHLPAYLRRQLGREDLLRRWPRLIRAMQYAAILSEGEAIGAVRDLADSPRYGGAEAVVHYGGPLAVLAGAVRCRQTVRALVRKGHFTAYAPCVHCGDMTVDPGAQCYKHRAAS